MLEQTTARDPQKQAVPTFTVTPPVQTSSRNVENSPRGLLAKQTQLNSQPIRAATDSKVVAANIPVPVKNGRPVDDTPLDVQKEDSSSKIAPTFAKLPAALRFGREARQPDSSTDESKVRQAFKAPIVSGPSASGQEVFNSLKNPEAHDMVNKTQNAAQTRGIPREAEQNEVAATQALGLQQRRGPNIDVGQASAQNQQARTMPNSANEQSNPLQIHSVGEVQRDFSREAQPKPADYRLGGGYVPGISSPGQQQTEKTFAERTARGLENQSQSRLRGARKQDGREVSRGEPGVPRTIDTEQRSQLPSVLTPGTRALKVHKVPDAENDGVPNSSSRSDAKGEADLRRSPAANSSGSLTTDHEQQPTRQKVGKVLDESEDNTPTSRPFTKKATTAVSPLAALQRIAEGGSWKDGRSRPSEAQPDAQDSPNRQEGRTSNSDQRAHVTPPASRVHIEGLDGPVDGPAPYPVDLGRTEIPSFPVPQKRADLPDLDRNRESPSQMFPRAKLSDKVTKAAANRVGGVDSTPIRPSDQNAVKTQPFQSPLSLFSEPKQHGRQDGPAPTKITVSPARLIANDEELPRGPDALETAGVVPVKGVTIRAPQRQQEPVLSSAVAASTYEDDCPPNSANGRSDLAARKSVRANIVQVPWSQRYGQSGPQDSVEPIPAVPRNLPASSSNRDGSSDIFTQSQTAVGAGTGVIERPGDLKLNVSRNADNSSKPRGFGENGNSDSGTPIASHKRGFWDLYMGSSSKKHPEGSSEFAEVQPPETKLEGPAAPELPLASHGEKYASSDEQEQRAQKNLSTPLCPPHISPDQHGVQDCLLVASPASRTAPERGTLAEPIVDARPTDAKARRKSNRLASMYGAQLKIGQDIPMPPTLPVDGLSGNSTIDGTSSHSSGLMPNPSQSHDTPRSIDSTVSNRLFDSRTAGKGDLMLATQSEKGELPRPDQFGPSDMRPEGTGDVDIVVKSQPSRLPAQSNASIERVADRSAVPKSAELGDRSIIAVADSDDMLSNLGSHDAGQIRESQLPAPLSFQSNNMKDGVHFSREQSSPKTPASTNTRDLSASTMPALASPQVHNSQGGMSKNRDTEKARITSLSASADLAALWLGNDKSGHNEVNRNDDRWTEAGDQITSEVWRTQSRPFEMAQDQQVETKEPGQETPTTRLHADRSENHTSSGKHQPRGDDPREAMIPEGRSFRMSNSPTERSVTSEPNDANSERSSRLSHGRANKIEDSDRHSENTLEPFAYEKMLPLGNLKPSTSMTQEGANHRLAESIVPDSRSLDVQEATTSFSYTGEYRSATPQHQHGENSRSSIHDGSGTRFELLYPGATGTRPASFMSASTQLSADGHDDDAAPASHADDIPSPRKPAVTDVDYSSSQKLGKATHVGSDDDSGAQSVFVSSAGEDPAADVQPFSVRDERDDSEEVNRGKSSDFESPPATRSLI